MYVIQLILTLLICLASISSVFFSFRSRRSKNVLQRGLFAARTNICMGLLLILIAVFQMTMFTGSTLRVIIGAILLALGVFNLFAGLRNHGHFNRLLAHEGTK
ncbi:YtpI family protein [Paenibacillus sp. ACRRX]|uniref:YtpI family protein n=1 Tax=unclassified Paenibacillus TaxID=185978 RepID=UPI001EF56C30|nr:MULTISPECIES: YtpI family protein [unclassified Paenibacillus]MCG7405846.1 YtpI family protein [Paenibacillus sp. ACRRX]MDK8182293.1 YtpI family protein [Paenibacillus sp. UMB4589-SE434]